MDQRILRQFTFEDRTLKTSPHLPNVTQINPLNPNHQSYSEQTDVLFREFLCNFIKLKSKLLSKFYKTQYSGKFSVNKQARKCVCPQCGHRSKTIKVCLYKAVAFVDSQMVDQNEQEVEMKEEIELEKCQEYVIANDPEDIRRLAFCQVEIRKLFQ